MTIDRSTEPAVVSSLMALQGIHPLEEEIDLLVEGFAQTRADVEALYAMPGATAAVPATVFDARDPAGPDGHEVMGRRPKAVDPHR